jgi:uncharacterized protein (TIGR00369 family)
MEANKLTGLEFLTQMRDGIIPGPPISETMNIESEEVKKGYVKFIAKADKRHINPLGGVHGGFAATVLDSVTGCAVHTMLDAGIGFGTVDLNIKMLRPVPLEKELIAEGNVINISNRIGVSEEIGRAHV